MLWTDPEAARQFFRTQILPNLPDLTFLPDDAYLYFFALVYRTTEHSSLFKRHEPVDFTTADALNHKKSLLELFTLFANALPNPYTPGQFYRPLHETQDEYFVSQAYRGHSSAYIPHLLSFPVPFSFKRQTRYEHMLIAARSGHGKTTLLENLIESDLNADDQPSIVVLDTEPELIPKLERLARWKNRRLIIIDPRDKPSLNIFHFNQARMAKYDDDQQLAMFTSITETLEFLLSGLMEADLTTIQRGLFNNCITLLLAIPKVLRRTPTMRDLVELMRGKKTIPEQYIPVLRVLDLDTRAFFDHDYQLENYGRTRNEILSKLQPLITSPAIKQFLTTETNAIDFFEEINRGSVILIHPIGALLKEKNAGYMGKICFSLVLNAILERAIKFDPNSRPVMVYIDEAHQYYNPAFKTFVRRTRKLNAGLTLATQDFADIPDELKVSLAASTGIKIAGGVGSSEAAWFALQMRIDADQIPRKKYHWACYAHEDTDHKTIILPVGKSGLSDEPQLTEQEYQLLRAKNRAFVSGKSYGTPVVYPRYTPPPEPPTTKQLMGYVHEGEILGKDEPSPFDKDNIDF